MMLRIWCDRHDVAFEPFDGPPFGFPGDEPGVWSVDASDMACPQDPADEDEAEEPCAPTITALPDERLVRGGPHGLAVVAPEQDVLAPETGEAIQHLAPTSVDPSVRDLAERLIGGR